MEQCLLSYFIRNNKLVNSCDFNPILLKQGPGIYEVIRVIGSKPLFIEEHIIRFQNSAANEKIETGLTEFEIKQRIKTLIESNQLVNGNIRFQFNKSEVGGEMFLGLVIPVHYPTETEVKNGVKIESLSAIRKNPQTKRANLPVRKVADKMISDQTISEVLLVNNDGLITEGSSSNIFFIKGNQIVTPPASLVLEGITRKKIMAVAKNLNIPATEELIPIKDINSFDTCFISSTSRGVLPVKQIDDISYNVDNPLLTILSDSYNELVNNHINNFNW